MSENIIGFVCGTTDTSLFYESFIKRRFFKVFPYLITKMFSPATLYKMIETLIYPTRKEILELPKAELLIIAVDKKYRGTGVSQSLFYRLVGVFRNKGIPLFKVVAGENLIHAHRFYKKFCPQSIDSVQVHQGQNSIVYIYDTGLTEPYKEKK